MNMLVHFTENSAEQNTLLQFSCLQKLLVLDEFNEAYMKLFLLFLVRNNRKAECMEFYDEMENKLHHELNVAVPRELQQIYSRYMAE